MNWISIIAFAEELVRSDAVGNNDDGNIYVFPFAAFRTAFLVLSDSTPPFPRVVHDEVVDPFGDFHVSGLNVTPLGKENGADARVTEQSCRFVTHPCSGYPTGFDVASGVVSGTPTPAAFFTNDVHCL